MTWRDVKIRGSSHPGQDFMRLACYFRRLSKFTRFYRQNTVLKSIWKYLLLHNMQNTQLQYWSRDPASCPNVAASVLQIRPVNSGGAAGNFLKCFLAGIQRPSCKMRNIDLATFLMVIENYHLRDFPAAVRAIPSDCRDIFMIWKQFKG